MADNLLILFLKAPRSGFVKTRIAAELGPDEACRIYRQLAGTVLQRIRDIHHVEVRFAPDDARSQIEQFIAEAIGNVPASWSLLPQGDGDLGARLARAFSEAFERGAQRVVTIGSDCPDATRQDVESAFAKLNEHDAVLGPATDGGYWLIGTRAFHAHLFENISWSSDGVAEQTLAQAHSTHLTISLLRTLTDIDTAADWRKYSFN